MEEMDTYFKKGLPHTLYSNHYQLAEIFQGTKAEDWRKYLRDNDRFIIMEIAAISEADARKALQLLSSGEISSQQVSAIRQLLERSEQINQSTKEAKTFVQLNFNNEKEAFDTGEATVIANWDNATKLYNTIDLDKKRYIHRNGDGTLHFTSTTDLDELDYAYMRLFNPTNKIVEEAERWEENDVQ